MCLQILSNREWYCIIAPTHTVQYTNEFKELIGTAYMEGLIDQATYKYLNVQFPCEATFYALPKVHKNILEPQGRPIFSGIGALCENASKFIDFFLMPHVTSLPSYIKDTLDLLKQRAIIYLIGTRCHYLGASSDVVDVICARRFIRAQSTPYPMAKSLSHVFMWIVIHRGSFSRCPADAELFMSGRGLDLLGNIHDHIYYTSSGKMITPVSQHLDPYRGFNTSLVTFIALERVGKDPRGGGIGIKRSSREKSPGSKIKCHSSPGPK